MTTTAAPTSTAIAVTEPGGGSAARSGPPQHRTGIDMIEAGSVLLTLSFASGGAPAARRPSSVAGGPGGFHGRRFRPGSARFSTSRLRPTTPPGRGSGLTASGEQPPAVS